MWRLYLKKQYIQLHSSKSNETNRYIHPELVVSRGGATLIVSEALMHHTLVNPSNIPDWFRRFITRTPIPKHATHSQSVQSSSSPHHSIYPNKSSIEGNSSSAMATLTATCIPSAVQRCSNGQELASKAFFACEPRLVSFRSHGTRVGPLKVTAEYSAPLIANPPFSKNDGSNNNNDKKDNSALKTELLVRLSYFCFSVAN